MKWSIQCLWCWHHLQWYPGGSIAQNPPVWQDHAVSLTNNALPCADFSSTQHRGTMSTLQAEEQWGKKVLGRRQSVGWLRSFVFSVFSLTSWSTVHQNRSSMLPSNSKHLLWRNFNFSHPGLLFSLIIQWFLRFKTPQFNSSLHFKIGYQWHNSYIINIEIPLQF